MEEKGGGKRQVIPVVREELKVDRREVETGRVRVHKVVREREEVVDEPVVETRVEVQRRPVNAFVDEPAPTRQEGDTTIIPVYEEVVEKRLRLKEEIHITRKRVTQSEPQRVILREEEVVIERQDESVENET